MFPTLLCERFLFDRISLTSAFVAEASKWYWKIISSIDPSICLFFCRLRSLVLCTLQADFLVCWKNWVHFYSFAYSYLVSQHCLLKTLSFLHFSTLVPLLEITGPLLSVCISGQSIQCLIGIASSIADLGLWIFSVIWPIGVNMDSSCWSLNRSYNAGSVVLPSA